MSKIGLFYASSTGNTEQIAHAVKKALHGLDVTLHNIDGCTADAMAEYDYMIIGVSTWGEGDLQDDWDTFFPSLDTVDFSDKTAALFGLGDQEGYEDNFLDAMGTLYRKITERGASVIGTWPTDGYEFDASTAVVNGEFVGLAIDEDNQRDLSASRVTQWAELIRPYFEVCQVA